MGPKGQTPPASRSSTSQYTKFKVEGSNKGKKIKHAPWWMKEWEAKQGCLPNQVIADWFKRGQFIPDQAYIDNGQRHQDAQASVLSRISTFQSALSTAQPIVPPPTNQAASTGSMEQFGMTGTSKPNPEDKTERSGRLPEGDMGLRDYRLKEVTKGPSSAGATAKRQPPAPVEVPPPIQRVEIPAVPPPAPHRVPTPAPPEVDPAPSSLPPHDGRTQGRS